MVQALGKGCLLAQVDLKEVYRVVPVHTLDQRLLAVQWQRVVHVQRKLPFGLCSVLKFFSALWMLVPA